MCEQRIVMKNDCVYAVADITSVSPGHELIIPIRHVSRLEEEEAGSQSPRITDSSALATLLNRL